MVRIIGHFDGNAIIPDEAVDLPRDVPLRVTVETVEKTGAGEGLLKLAGLGAEVWGGIDPVEYQRREREGWE